MTRLPVPLRRELLLSFAVLFAVAMLLAVLGVVVLLPGLATPRDATLFLASLIVADLGILFGFGSYVLRKDLVSPVERLVEDVMQMTEGGEHRVGEMPNAELMAIGESVNTLADRLMRDQALLAENVASLERTNAQLVEARDHVIRAARLASVGTLAAGIAHEVGNPLGAILGYVDVARGRAQREGRDTSLLDAIRTEAVRIDRIVRSLLDYARPRENEGDATPPRDVVERVRNLLGAQGKLDEVETAWRYEEDLPPVDVDANRLEQVLVNLLLNALDAVKGASAPRITVRLHSEDVDVPPRPPRRQTDPSGANYMHRRRVKDPASIPSGAPERGRVVVLRVADNGPGIPEDDLERIFDPFFTTKPPGKGTGLGLAICARLVEGMEGRLDVANGERGGAVFTIRLPAAETWDVEGRDRETRRSAEAPREAAL